MGNDISIGIERQKWPDHSIALNTDQRKQTVLSREKQSASLHVQYEQCAFIFSIEGFFLLSLIDKNRQKKIHSHIYTIRCNAEQNKV